MNIVTPGTIDKALEILSREKKAGLLAGGTDLLLQTRRGRKKHQVLINLAKCGLSGIEVKDGKTVIGAMTRLSDIHYSVIIQKKYPLLKPALDSFATKQIRNVATIGGNLCNSSPAADLAPPLLIYNAVLNIAGPSGRRSVDIGEFFTGPGKTSLERGEILDSVELTGSKKTHEKYYKLGIRRGSAISIVSASMAADIDDKTGAINDCAIALGAVAPTPIRCMGTENFLRNTGGESPDIAAVRDKLLKDISPITDVRASKGHRFRVAMNFVTDFLENLYA